MQNSTGNLFLITDKTIAALIKLHNSLPYRKSSVNNLQRENKPWKFAWALNTQQGGSSHKTIKPIQQTTPERLLKRCFISRTRDKYEIYTGGCNCKNRFYCQRGQQYLSWTKKLTLFILPQGCIVSRILIWGWRVV